MRVFGDSLDIPRFVVAVISGLLFAFCPRVLDESCESIRLRETFAQSSYDTLSVSRSVHRAHGCALSTDMRFTLISRARVLLVTKLSL